MEFVVVYLEQSPNQLCRMHKYRVSELKNGFCLIKFPLLRSVKSVLISVKKINLHLSILPCTIKMNYANQYRAYMNIQILVFKNSLIQVSAIREC